MPHPQEQKLHEVVNSLTSESFNCLVADRIAGTSTSRLSASPPPPPRVSRSRSRRLMVELGVPLTSIGLAERFRVGASSDSSMGFSVRLQERGRSGRPSGDRPRPVMANAALRACSMSSPLRKRRRHDRTSTCRRASGGSPSRGNGVPFFGGIWRYHRTGFGLLEEIGSLPARRLTNA